MFESQAAGPQHYLYEGAYVRLDIRWHHNPVFLCEKTGDHFCVAGYHYGLDGMPLRPFVPTPVITAVVAQL